MNTAPANTTTKNDALRNALVLAGQRLAATGIHGRFRLVRRPHAVTVKFLGEGGSNPRIDIQALVEAVLHARSAGFEAERFGLEAEIAA